MARFFYSLLFYLITPFVLLRLLWRARRAPAYARRWRERFGLVPPVVAGKQVLWVHAVSVGETVAAAPLIKALLQRYPQAVVAVTTMTPTGSERVAALFGASVYHAYAPYDLPLAWHSFLRRVAPSLLIIMETELWPNMIHACRKRAIPVVVANARLSEKSARGYKRGGSLTRAMLRSLTVVAAQNNTDGARFVDLGVASSAVRVTGNLKFDVELDTSLQQRALALREQWRGSSQRPVWLAASTHRGEDELILDAFARIRTQQPQLLLVLVPRHPERFDEVATLCATRQYRVCRRSAGTEPTVDDEVLLGDTMGELVSFFGACDLTFVGGSLVPVGGHNLIEPAAWGIPVLTGPHLFNFAEVARVLREADALLTCRDAEQIAQRVIELLDDSDARQRTGQAAREVVAANRGALHKTLAIVEGLLTPR